MTDTEDRSWWPPSWLVSTAFIALILAGISGGFAWYEIKDARMEDRRLCNRSVNNRDDIRSMWLELFEAFPDAAIETGLRTKFEERLPPLYCDGSDPVPEERP